MVIRNILATQSSEDPIYSENLVKILSFSSCDSESETLELGILLRGAEGRWSGVHPGLLANYTQVQAGSQVPLGLWDLAGSCPLQ